MKKKIKATTPIKQQQQKNNNNKILNKQHFKKIIDIFFTFFSDSG